MRLLRFAGIFGLLSLMLATGSAHADSAAAQAAYMRGLAKEKTKDYQGAIAEFEDSLKADPKYAYSHKELGNCYYYLDEKPQALQHYDAYLSSVPTDSFIVKLASGMRSRVPAQAPEAEAAPAATPVPFKPQFALRGMLGWGWSIQDASVGDNVSNGYGYQIHPGQGLNFEGEVLYELSPNIALGLGTWPLSISEELSSRQALTGRDISDKTSAKFSTMPVALFLYGSVPYSAANRRSLLLGFAVGYAFGGPWSEHNVTKYSGAAFPYPATYTRDDQYALDGTLAYRATLGEEYKLTDHVSVFYGFSYDTASFSASTEDYHNARVRDSDGKTMYDYVYKRTYSNEAPAYKNPVTKYTSSTSGLVTTTVDTYDDGVVQSTHTTVTDAGTGDVTDAYNVSVKGQRNSVLSITRVSMALGVTWRF